MDLDIDRSVAQFFLVVVVDHSHHHKVLKVNKQDRFAYKLAGKLLLELRLEPGSIVLDESDPLPTALGVSRGKDPALPTAGTSVSLVWDVTKDDWTLADVKV